MLRRLINERFQLRLRQELVQAPAYGLVLVTYDSVGRELQVSRADCTKPDACGIKGGDGDVTYTGVTMSQLADSIEEFAAAPVRNRTGLGGRFDLHLQFNKDSKPSLNTALRDQAGLILQLEHYFADFFYIEHVEKPTPD